MNAARRRIAVVLDGPPAPAWQRRALENLAESPVLELAEVVLLGAQRRRVLWRERDAIERHLLKLGEDAMELGPVAATTDTARGPAGPGGELVVWLSERPPPAGEPREVLALCHGGFSEPADAAFSRAVLQRRSSLQSDLLLIRGADAVVVERTVSEVRAFSVDAQPRHGAVEARARDPARGRACPRSVAARAAAGAGARRAFGRGAAGTCERDVGACAGCAAAVSPSLAGRVRVRAVELRVRGWAGRAASELVRWQPGHLYADPFLFEHEGAPSPVLRGGGWRRASPGSSRTPSCAPTGRSADRAGAGPAGAPPPLLPVRVRARGRAVHDPRDLAAGRVELYRAIDFPARLAARGDPARGPGSPRSTLCSSTEGACGCSSASPRPRELARRAASVLAPAAVAGRGCRTRATRSSPTCAARARQARSSAGGRGSCALPRTAAAATAARSSFREIDVLSLEDYAEHEIARHRPGRRWCAARTHTYAADGRFEAIDLRRRELRLRRAGGRRGASGAR